MGSSPIIRTNMGAWCKGNMRDSKPLDASSILAAPANLIWENKTLWIGNVLYKALTAPKLLH